MSPLDQAIKLSGGLSALAKNLNCKPQVVNNWRSRGVPPERCLDIEIATGGKVTRQKLRPDIFSAAPTTGARRAA